jgi:hypothetical protein
MDTIDLEISGAIDATNDGLRALRRWIAAAPLSVLVTRVELGGAETDLDLVESHAERWLREEVSVRDAEALDEPSEPTD